MGLIVLKIPEEQFPRSVFKKRYRQFQSPGDTISLVFVCLLFFFFLTRSYNQDVSIRVNTASVQFNVSQPEYTGLVEIVIKSPPRGKKLNFGIFSCYLLLKCKEEQFNLRKVPLQLEGKLRMQLRLLWFLAVYKEIVKNREKGNTSVFLQLLHCNFSSVNYLHTLC